MIKEKKLKLRSIIWLIIAEVIIVIAGLLLGFRITYAPYLENNWDAIAAVASWASVAVSGMAIYYAIQVPRKIAEDQNRIALFEKRYAVYDMLNNCIGYAYMLKRFNESGEDWKKWFFICFSEHTTLDDVLSWEEQGILYNTVSNTLRQVEPLFGTDISAPITELTTRLLLLIQAEHHHDNVLKRQAEYIKQVELIEKEYLPQIKNLLILN